MNTQIPMAEGPTAPRPPMAAPPPRQASYSYRGVGVAWLVGGLIAAVITIRFALELLGASTAADFTRFIYALTDPLVAPFQGIFPTSGRHGNLFDAAALVAIAIYLLVTWGVVALVKITSTSRGARTPVE